MNAIILAAGMGTRLKPLTNTMPKCLTPINGISILENALRILDRCGISETIIVVGYSANAIIGSIGYKYRKMEIRYIENSIFQMTSTSYSLFLALENLTTDDFTLIIEGDVFFEEDLLLALLDKKTDAITIVEKYNPILDGSMVQIEKKIVTDWIHKKSRYKGFVLTDKYKTVNIHLFSAKFITQYVIPITKEFITKNNGANEPMEYIFQIIVRDQKLKICSMNANNYKWFEIDNYNDLVLAEKLFSSVEKSTNILGGFDEISKQ